MDCVAVIAKDACGKALHRVAISATTRLVYIANPSLLDRIKSGETYAVGFPWEDVFEFDQAVFDTINRTGMGWENARPIPAGLVREV